MTSYPSISVIVPSFNQGEFIEETLLSILNQNYPNLEILVLDAGSTDRTVEVIQKYESHLAYWHSKPDKGQADAINQGMALSSGEILCWLNSDDLYLPGTLLDVGQRFRGLVDRNYLIYGDTRFLYQSGKPKGASDVQCAAPFDPMMLTYYDYIAQPSAFWTRKLWKQVGNLELDYHYVLDWDWLIRAAKIAEFEYVRQFYAVYRIHENHKTSNGGSKRKQEVLEIVSKHSSEYWIELYQQVDASYSEIKPLMRRLGKLGIPNREWFASLLLPDLRAKLQHPQDLFKVLAMYS